MYSGHLKPEIDISIYRDSHQLAKDRSEAIHAESFILPGSVWMEDSESIEDVFWHIDCKNKDLRYVHEFIQGVVS